MAECVLRYTNIYKEIRVKLDIDIWNDHVPKSVGTSHEGKVTILWNQEVRADRTVPNNKPDNIIRYNKKSKMHIAISGDINVIKTEAEKILKYKDLIQEI